MMKTAPTAIAIFLFFISLQGIFAGGDSNEIIQQSSELTAEETQLLAELEDASALYEPLEDLAIRTEKELERLRRMENEFIPHLTRLKSNVKSTISTLNAKTMHFLSVIEDLNDEEISAFTDRLEAAIDDEVSRRENLPDSTIEDTELDDLGRKKITMKEIQEDIDVDAMIAQPGTEFKQFVYGILRQKWIAVKDDYLNSCKKAVDEKKVELMKGSKKTVVTKDYNSCVNASEAANKVLASLVALQNDEKQSDALTGASIVYGEDWTSDTYQPSNNDSKNTPALKLGDARVRQYIPEDWERLMPEGWKDWDVSILNNLFSSESPQSILPTSLWHSLPSPMVALVENSFQKSHSASTETVLDANMHLGSCWKMSGRGGKVTLKFDEPTVIETITVDHYPWLPSAHNPKIYTSHATSAPRFMRLQGYRSCEEEECNAQLGFDDSEPVKYNPIEYKIDNLLSDEEDMDFEPPTSSSQTFSLSVAANTEVEDDFQEEAGCSAVKPTCDGAPGETNVPVQAFTLFIDQNWGNPDYTCIYRIRINERR